MKDGSDDKGRVLCFIVGQLSLIPCASRVLKLCLLRVQEPYWCLGVSHTVVKLADVTRDPNVSMLINQRTCVLFSRESAKYSVGRK